MTRLIDIDYCIECSKEMIEIENYHNSQINKNMIFKKNIDHKII